MKVAIVASTNVPITPDVVGVVLAAIGMSDSVLIRGPRHNGSASEIEGLAWHLARLADRAVVIFRPGLLGPASVYNRDISLVTDSDKVFAFFEKGYSMTGGTGHVVEVALRSGVPVEAYEVDPIGPSLRYIGSEDGGEYLHE